MHQDTNNVYGKVTAALKAAGMWSNTLLVFSADNGGEITAAGNNFPLSVTSTAFWGFGFLNRSTPPHMRRVINCTWCPCSSEC